MGENPIGFDDDLNYYEEYQEPVYSSEDAYNKNLISIDGIKDIYHISQYSVGQENYIAYCTSPVTITAQCALDDFSVYPMYYINEYQLWDEKLPLFPDGKKAQDYDWYESHQEIYASEPDIDLAEYVYAQKGEKYTLTKPGYYHVRGTIYDEKGNYENDIYTDIVIKITDLNAVYAPSKVLVDGEEYKFEAYNIEGNNYFKLRDLAEIFMFDVDWDAAANSVIIDTLSALNQ